MIDFTVRKHGHFDIRAKTEEEAKEKFQKWVKDNKKEMVQWIDHFTFDYDIKANYVIAVES